MSGAPIKRTWMDDAACRDQPPRRFTDPAGTDDVRRACRTCHTCPVRENCLTVALAHPSYADAGIWGGTTAAQRRQIRNGRLRVADVLRADPPKKQEKQPPASRDEPQPTSRADTEEPKATSTRPEPGRPRLTVHRDSYGDYTDASGRVLIFKIFGEPPYMLMIDRRPIIRTASIREASEHAWDLLRDRDRVRCGSAVRREVPGPDGSAPKARGVPPSVPSINPCSRAMAETGSGRSRRARR